MDPDPGGTKTCGSGFGSGTLLFGSGSKSKRLQSPDLKHWIRATGTSRVTGPNPRWPPVDVGDSKTEQTILPVNMVRDERDVESEGEPLSSKHKENVEQKVQEIFGQNL